jgi:hypothetical protein
MLWDVFCNGGTFFEDGRCMVVGGRVEYDPFYGDPRTTVFDRVTNQFNQLQSMAHGRWYATAITNRGQTRTGKHTLTVTVTGSNITDPAGNYRPRS